MNNASQSVLYIDTLDENIPLYDISEKYIQLRGEFAFFRQIIAALDSVHQEELEALAVCEMAIRTRYQKIAGGKKVLKVLTRRMASYYESRFAFQEPDSLNRPLEYGVEDLELGEALLSEDSLEGTTLQTEVKTLVAEMLKSGGLSNQEKKILILRFGLEGVDGMVWRQIGEYLGVPRSTVALLEMPLLEKCGIYLKSVRGLAPEDVFS